MNRPCVYVGAARPDQVHDTGFCLIHRLLGRVNDTVNKITYKMEENDPWYEEKTRQIENTEAQLKRLCGLAESLAQCRSDLASATGAFSQGAAMLSSAEEAHSLSRALAHLARVEVLTYCSAPPLLIQRWQFELSPKVGEI